MGREMGGRFKREGLSIYLLLIHVEVRQKTTKFWKAIILQLKKKKTLGNTNIGYLDFGEHFMSMCVYMSKFKMYTINYCNYINDTSVKSFL